MKNVLDKIERWHPWSRKCAEVPFSRKQRIVWGIFFAASGFLSIALSVYALVDLLPFRDTPLFTGSVLLQVRCTADAVAMILLPFLAMYLFNGAVASYAGVPGFGGDQY